MKDNEPIKMKQSITQDQNTTILPVFTPRWLITRLTWLAVLILSCVTSIPSQAGIRVWWGGVAWRDDPEVACQDAATDYNQKSTTIGSCVSPK